MEYDQQETDQYIVLKLKEHIDLYNANDFIDIVDKLIVDATKHLIIDLEEVPFFDSSGLGALIKISKKLVHKDKLLLMIRPNETVKKLLFTYRMNKLFYIFDTMGEAESFLQSYGQES